MKIVIAGIGGVGGYFGGLLAGKYQNTKTEIYFLARGENLNAIRSRGLLMQTMNGEFTVHPKLATSDAREIGVADYLICCTKGYDLENVIQTCSPLMDQNTIILPLLNGVDARERIEKIFPKNEVWDGCVYLVSRLAAAGTVKETG